MRQDGRWEKRYQEMGAFIDANYRNPSQHRIEEHLMLNFIKRGLMPVWDIALGIVRGILTEKTNGPPLANQFLRVIDFEKFADVAILAKEPIS